MPAISHINGIPIFDTPQEAMVWAKKHNNEYGTSFDGYHTHSFIDYSSGLRREIKAYMPGNDHEQTKAYWNKSLINNPPSPPLSKPKPKAPSQNVNVLVETPNESTNQGFKITY
tara:strand:- start:1013 stop:1354 length:342 start_codon:yes stop_codon:yes gene_type:complete